MMSMKDRISKVFVFYFMYAEPIAPDGSATMLSKKA